MAAETPAEQVLLPPEEPGPLTSPPESKDKVQGNRLSFSEVKVVVEYETPDELPATAPKLSAPLYWCRQFVRRVWQLFVYICFVAPPSIVVGFLCSFLLYGIRIVTSLRDGTCGDDDEQENAYRVLLTSSPLIACENVVNANRWLLFLLSFSGVFVAALYTYLGNVNAAGGMNTILKGIRSLDDEIDRICNEQELRNPQALSLAEPVEPSGEFKGLVALRMCPLVWIGTVSTHLTGGAAGREGSALQMAASVFSKYCDFLDATLGKINPFFLLSVNKRRAALVAAVGVGFAGIFGVPVTGAIFAVEVLRVGELSIGEMLTPAIIGSFFSDWTCRLVSEKVFDFASHSKYDCASCQGGRNEEGHEVPGMPQNWVEPNVHDGLELLAVIPAAFAFGLCGYAFEFLLHHFKHFFGVLAGKLSRGNANAKALLTPFIGGWFVVALWLVLCPFGTSASFIFAREYNGTDAKSSTFAQAYLGLSVYEPGTSISTCFLTEQGLTQASGVQLQDIHWYSFLLKLIFTTLTLGAGFKGGEVTPIFYIGGALGNWCGWVLGQDRQLFSALGLLSVFAAAANTPIACTFMGIELFGGAKALPYLLSCYLAYLVSNTSVINGIYAAQDKPRQAASAVTPYSRSAPHRA